MARKTLDKEEDCYPGRYLQSLNTWDANNQTWRCQSLLNTWSHLCGSFLSNLDLLCDSWTPEFPYIIPFVWDLGDLVVFLISTCVAIISTGHMILYLRTVRCGITASFKKIQGPDWYIGSKERKWSFNGESTLPLDKFKPPFYGLITDSYHADLPFLWWTLKSCNLYWQELRHVYEQ